MSDTDARGGLPEDRDYPAGPRRTGRGPARPTRATLARTG